MLTVDNSSHYSFQQQRNQLAWIQEIRLVPLLKVSKIFVSSTCNVSSANTVAKVFICKLNWKQNTNHWNTRRKFIYHNQNFNDRLLDATANRHINTRKNLVPASFDEELVMRSKRQSKVLLLKFRLWYMNFLLVSICQPNEFISRKQ